MSGGMPPPGWYDDPTGGGGQRWWTGLGWSEHVAEPAARLAAASVHPPASSTPFIATTTTDPLAGSWSVPGSGQPILRPGYDDPMLRGYAGAGADTYRSWFASIAGFVAAILALGFGRPDFSLLFAAIGAVPLLLLPGKLAARRRAVGVARNAARKEGRRPGSVPSERLVSWREVVLGGLVAALLVGYVLLFWSAVRPSPAAHRAAAAVEPRGTVADGRATYDALYGAFARFARTGRGDAAIPLPQGVTAVVVDVKHTGAGELTVLAVDSAGRTTESGEVRGSGDWATTAAFGLNLFVAAPARLDVRATGTWKVTVAPVSSVPEFRLPAHGSAPGVFLYSGSPGPWTVTRTGSGAFSLTTFNTSGTPYPMVDQVGAYRGSVQATAGFTIVSIRGDGAWTVSAR